MKKNKRLFLVCTVIILSGSFVFNVFATGINEAQQKKDKLESQLQDTKNEIKGLKGTKNKLQDYVSNLDSQLNDITENISDLENQIEEKQNQIQQAEDNLENAESEKESQYIMMRKRIKYMYERGNSSYVETLLESGSIAEMLNKLIYIQQVTDYDRTLFENYKTIIDQIETSKSTIESEYIQLQGLQENITAKQSELSKLLEQKKNEVGEYSDQIDDKQQVAAIYEGEIDAQNEIIALIQQAMAEEKKKQEAASSQSGEKDKVTDNSSDKPKKDDSSTNTNSAFTWPCPASRTISGDFGLRESPIAGASTYHNGIDIAAPYGSNIVAAESGTVLISGYSKTAGNWIVINHGNELCSVYMHSSSLLVSKGASVSRGQVIAKVGSTGLSTGNHLHFGVSVNGSYVNPWKYL